MNKAAYGQTPQGLPASIQNSEKSEIVAIPFTKNWNNKLSGDCFTTIRLHNSKYQVGHTYDILLNNKALCQAIVVDIKIITLSQINDWIALLDTGMDSGRLRKMLRQMYAKYTLTWETQQLDYILLFKVR